MCAACVAQGAAYLVPVYAVVKARTTWQRRRRPEDVVTPEATSDGRHTDEKANA